MLPIGGTMKCFASILNADKSLEANLKTIMVGHVGEDCFDVKLSLILGIMNSTDRREEKRNFLIQGRRFRRSFKNYCNYRYFMKLSRLLSIVKLGIDVLLSEHLQSRCIDSSMYCYTPMHNKHCQILHSSETFVAFLGQVMQVWLCSACSSMHRWCNPHSKICL